MHFGLPHATTWVTFGNIMLSERSQTRKATQCVTPSVRNVQNKQISGCQGLGEGVGEMGNDC